MLMLHKIIVFIYIQIIILKNRFFSAISVKMSSSNDGPVIYNGTGSSIVMDGADSRVYVRGAFQRCDMSADQAPVRSTSLTRRQRLRAALWRIYDRVSSLVNSCKAFRCCSSGDEGDEEAASDLFVTTVWYHGEGNPPFWHFMPGRVGGPENEGGRDRVLNMVGQPLSPIVEEQEFEMQLLSGGSRRTNQQRDAEQPRPNEEAEQPCCSKYLPEMVADRPLYFQDESMEMQPLTSGRRGADQQRGEDHQCSSKDA